MVSAMVNPAFVQLEGSLLHPGHAHRCFDLLPQQLISTDWASFVLIGNSFCASHH